MKNLFLLALLISAASLQGCSFLVDLALFNNTSTPIEVCNLLRSPVTCTVIPSKALGKVTLSAQMAAPQWRYRISHDNESSVYEFQFAPYPEQASEVYCHGLFSKRCDIPVQLEESGLLYWGGKTRQLPIQEFPDQPLGFPVRPHS